MYLNEQLAHKTGVDGPKKGYPRRIHRVSSHARLLATPRGVVVLPAGGQFSLLHGASCIGIMLSLGHGLNPLFNPPRCAERATRRTVSSSFVS